MLNEIANGTEIADGAVTEAKLADGAVTEAKLGDRAVTEAKLSIGSVHFNQLSFDVVETGVATLAPHTSLEQPVLNNAGAAALSAPYFADAHPTHVTGSGSASVEASIVYQSAAGSFNTTVAIRMVNHGSATVGVAWSVRVFKGSVQQIPSQ